MTWSEKYQPTEADIIEAIRGVGVQTPQAAARREELFGLWLEDVQYDWFQRGRGAADRALAESEEELAYWKDQFYKAVEALERTNQAYRFTAGRIPSPRERRKIKTLLNAKTEEHSHGSE